MRCHSATMILFLVGASTLAGAPAATWAQTPLEPVHHVYPNSTYEEIQQAIDEGGTVYFAYGQYDQLADPPRGFNLGTSGKDVHIVGLPGPRHERPRINGGNVVFRAGRIPMLGFFGQPVSFRIENLELVNPRAMAPVYSRIGVWVTALGAYSVIDNCKIKIIGELTDPNHATNHSVGIWFWLVPFFGAPPPPSRATIDVTNNTIEADRVHEGIHVDSFWPLENRFTSPRALVGNNQVHVTRLGGYHNGAGTGGATLATAVLVAGNLQMPIVTNNVIRGDGRSPGADPPVESVAIGLVGTGSADEALGNAMVLGNDSRSFKADFQLWIEPIVAASHIVRNSWGSADRAGVRCEGRGNQFAHDHFYGHYPGWEGPGGGPGLFWFTAASDANTVKATELNGPPYRLDICSQVLDETGGANQIYGCGWRPVW